MACKCAPSLDLLRNELNALFPNRDKASDGCCGDAAHAARTSDHNAKTSGVAIGYACARDFDEDISTVMGDKELMWMCLGLLSDTRVKYLIYEGMIYYPTGVAKVYTGINAHTHHLHVSIYDWAFNDMRPWNIKNYLPSTTPTPPTIPEDDMGINLFFVKHDDLAHKKVYLSAPGCRPQHVEKFNDFILPGTDFQSVAGLTKTQILAPPPGAGKNITDGDGTTLPVWHVKNGPLFGLSNETGEPL